MIGLYSSLVVFFLLQAHQSTAVFNITAAEPLFPSQTLVSSGQIFELGFFTPNGSANRYVGIWYKSMTPSKIVWVANRDTPLAHSDQSAKLKIGSDGNLKLVDKQQNIVWSTNVSVHSNNTTAMLTDGGNFVLQDRNSVEIWASFDDPTDTLLPNMEIGLNNRTGERRYLVSWKNDNYPSSGYFVTGITWETPPQLFTWNGSSPYWRSGPWDRSTFIGMPEMDSSYFSGYVLQQDLQQGTAYFSANTKNNSLFAYGFVSPGGVLTLIIWDYGSKSWSTNWEAPSNSCEVYGTCGPFGLCNSLNSPICRCVKGFTPRSKEEWNSRNWTRGCIRETELNCQKNTSRSASMQVKKDVFVQMNRMKVPDSAEYLKDIGDEGGCQSWCLNNCTCLAYSYVGTIGCLVWAKDLIDMQEFSTAGQDVCVRVAHDNTGMSIQTRLIISVSTMVGIVFVGAAIFSLCKWRTSKRGTNNSNLLLNFTLNVLKDKTGEMSLGNSWKDQLKQVDASELTMFSFSNLLHVTNNFDATNKLGQGGFGPVYKGKLNDGKEIAVKRLSSSSGQGMEEFKNEIILISKLQHRNLVRLMGCCIEGEEKILVYEYLSNKSLDTFLFDSGRKAELNWDIRFQIIRGIASGLQYLHRESNLRVIHRDLKASNILLDEKMNPKISDFGLARIFEGTQVLLNTHKVVGTLGYMSPEYAMGGIFSEKSDVYSFGVLLLEIVSGKKNTSLYYQGHHFNLLSYAWQLWSEGTGLDLTDEAIVHTCSTSEVMRCILVGLLSVQDHATDRPNMSSLVLMLSGESELPQPRPPTFTFKSEIPSHDVKSEWECIFSTNSITNSVVDGR
ncbi:G-type lectin S-receptor-like serine/threonine-protein kinase At1g61370 [Rhodamnia argentea]|uniref:Receptor-like serine/threonine-protein kinase n=1 Tax=Rhodamnia argentea TaxID=178133 RepID=A0ABM3H6J8_9MYRT|nr:G-type lectin S-receptor-like serine/threonine-protein kinase At1g61370 [Rhodamnia argentea]